MYSIKVVVELEIPQSVHFSICYIFAVWNLWKKENLVTQLGTMRSDDLS
jgi:hypothetical protein